MYNILLIGWRSSLQVQSASSNESSSIAIFSKSWEKVQNTIFAIAVGARIIVNLKFPVASTRHCLLVLPDRKIKVVKVVFENQRARCGRLSIDCGLAFSRKNSLKHYKI